MKYSNDDIGQNGIFLRKSESKTEGNLFPRHCNVMFPLTGTDTACRHSILRQRQCGGKLSHDIRCRKPSLTS